MKFFNIDCHISVIADIKNIFETFGHDIDQWSLSGHRWIFNLPECKSPILNENNWKNVDEDMVDNFYKFHKKELDKYDGFICTHHIHFLKLFEKFNKPIIVVASTRYDFPFLTSPERLKWLEDSLNNNSNLILIANNEFDKHYCEKFLTRPWSLIPSLCSYTQASYKPSTEKAVVFSKFPLTCSENHLPQSELKSYTWEELYKYDHIIHFPYNTSTMSIFEQSQAGMPLLFPSLDFSLKLLANGVPLFSELVFPNDLPERQLHLFLNKKWLSYADFYNGTIRASYFNSLDELKIDKRRRGAVKEDRVLDLWKKVLW